MNKKDKLDKLKGLMKDINKKQKDVVLDFASSQEDWERLSSGVEEFDKFVGNGFPYGHTSIIWGSSASGKSSLMYSTVAQAQKEGKIVAFLDLENSFSNKRAEVFGVNCEELIIGRYAIAEEALDTIIKLAKEEAVDVIILDSIHCYDKETMILTNEGWKYFKDLNGKELVLSLNKDNETTSYVKINKIIKHYHKGKMYKYEGRHCNFCMTDNNRLLFGNPSHKYKFTGWKFGTIKEAINKWKYNYFLLKKNFKWNGINPKYIKIKGKKRKNSKKEMIVKIKTNVFMDFLGWWLSEGSSGFKTYNNGSKKDCVAIRIHQSIKSPFLDDIEKTMKNMPFEFKRYLNGDEVSFVIHNSFFGRYLIDNFIKDKEKFLNNKRYGSKLKMIPSFIKNLSKENLEILLKSYYKGDGWLSWGGNKCISTSSKQMSLDLKEIYLKTGQYVNINTEKIKKQKKWIVDHWANLGGEHYTLIPYTTNNMSHSIIKKNIEEIDYDDYIYDVEIDSPTHLIYLMRKGTSYWASNSMAPSGEVEDKKGDKSLKSDTMALLARKMAQFFRMASTHIYKSKICLILIGQTRTDLGGFIALQKLSGGCSLIHNSVLTIHQRRGAKKNNPTIDYKEAWIDPDGKFHLNTRHEDAGFSVVLKIDKKQCDGGKNEGSDLEIPYYFETGFKNPYEEKEELPIIIDPTANEEEREQIIKELENKDKLHLVKGFEKTLPQIKKGDVIISETENEIIEEAISELKEEKPKKKKRGRPKKEKK